MSRTTRRQSASADSPEPARVDGRTRRRIEAMRKIQSAALELFRTRGFDAVTVEQIAAAAGVGPATVYRGFGTKERIVLWDEYDPMILAAIERQLGKHATILESVRHALAESLASIYDRDHQRIARRARLITAHPGLAAAAGTDRDALRAALSSVLVRTKASRDVLDADLTAGVVVATLEAAVTEWLRRRQKTPLRTVMGLAFARLSRLETRGRGTSR